MKQELSYYDNCFAEMQEMFNIPHEMFFELNDAFFEISSHQIELLRSALLQKNREQLILHAHTLKGSSASLRHMTISDSSANIEYHAKENTSFDYATEIYSLSQEITRLRSAYMHWKQNQ